jgi:glycine hydroxymethyltransferase
MVARSTTRAVMPRENPVPTGNLQIDLAGAEVRVSLRGAQGQAGEEVRGTVWTGPAPDRGSWNTNYASTNPSSFHRASLGGVSRAGVMERRDWLVIDAEERRYLAMDLAHGGHLSHGARVSLTGKIYQFEHYPVNADSEMIDLDLVEQLAREFQPKLIVAGASAYPRIIDFAGFRRIADEVGARLMVDMAHIAGLVATGVHPSPIPHADVVTTTTHKTLRGPRSGLILCRKKLAKKIDSAVFPGGQGGPLMHLVAARAVCFQEAMTDTFRDYAKKIVENSIHLGEILSGGGLRLVSGGTDNHMILADLRSMDLTGDIAEAVLGKAGIVVNMNMIPYDPAPPRRPSGMRIGTPTITSRGMGSDEIILIGNWILEILKAPTDEDRIGSIRTEVRELCQGFPTRI